MSKQPSKITLKDALASLHQRGRLEEEQALKNKIELHFGELFTEEQLLQMPLDDIVGTVQVFNMLYPIFYGNEEENTQEGN